MLSHLPAVSFDYAAKLLRRYFDDYRVFCKTIKLFKSKVLRTLASNYVIYYHYHYELVVIIALMLSRAPFR